MAGDVEGFLLLEMRDLDKLKSKLFFHSNYYLLKQTSNTNQLQVLLTIIQFTLLTLQNNMITYSNLQSNLFTTYKHYTNT